MTVHEVGFIIKSSSTSFLILKMSKPSRTNPANGWVWVLLTERTCQYGTDIIHHDLLVQKLTFSHIWHKITTNINVKNACLPISPVFFKRYNNCTQNSQSFRRRQTLHVCVYPSQIIWLFGWGEGANPPQKTGGRVAPVMLRFLKLET